MRAHRDEEGFYAALGVPPGASRAEIKRAYRRLAKRLHPDRNKAPGAAEAFARVHDAYRVLDDPAARARYDAGGTGAGRSEGGWTGAGRRPGASAGPPAPSGWAWWDARAAEETLPARCADCGEVSPLLRHVVVREVRLDGRLQRDVRVRGWFCPRCAARRLARASARTALRGWWGRPWSVDAVAAALLQNALGGEQDPERNVELHARQAWALARRGQRYRALVALREARDVRFAPFRERHLLAEVAHELGARLDRLPRARFWTPWLFVTLGHGAAFLALLAVLATVVRAATGALVGAG